MRNGVYWPFDTLSSGVGVKRMADERSLINIGELSKPATVLVQKISDAIGAFLEPWQILRVARAEAEADKMKALAQIEITELQRRALERWIAEEAKKQDNMESIIEKALPQVEDGSKPQDVNDDWIANFFDKCRLISDEDMQTLWAKVLAGEANSPGKYSKRTVSFLASLDKADADLFTTLCGFAWLSEEVMPLIYDVDAPIYAERGITFDTLQHMDDIGFVSFDPLLDARSTHLPKNVRLLYHDTPINIEFPKDEGNSLNRGKVLLSKIGQELASMCGSESVPGFLDYIVERWSEGGLIPSSPYPRRKGHIA